MQNYFSGLKTLLLFLFHWEIVFAQPENTPYEIKKINAEVKIDGLVNEDFWQSVKPLPLTMHWPNFQGQITEDTEIRVAYDDQYLYVGAICYDSNPEDIQAITFKRDKIGQELDHLVLLLDTYNDNENMLLFMTSPTGSRADMAVKNDAQGDGAASSSWNTYWVAESTMDDKGWQTEIRIPFSSLRFQVENNKVEMGMTAYRYVARKRELNIFPSIRPDWGFMSFAKPSQAQTITFEGIQNKRPWYTSPYLLLGTGHHYETDMQGDYLQQNDKNIQVGLDVQHAFSDNLNADFTVNTDFAQVEADNQIVNLTRFSLFFPEKRRFFLERASTFDFKYDLSNNMFYSRRIGIQGGEMIPLYGGVRLVGRVDKWDVGLINMQSRAKGEFFSENFGVLRLRKNILNERSYMGGMYTSRIDTEGNKNFTYGTDAIINMFKQDYLQINIAQTYDTQDSTGASSLNRARAYIMWENRVVNGFGYKFSFSRVGDKYNPGIGFERRFNFSQFEENISYSWFAPEDSKLLQTTIALIGDISMNNANEKLETYTYGFSSAWQWNRSARLNLGVEKFYDNVPNDFSISDDINIVSDEYSNLTGVANFQTPAVGLMQMKLETKLGTFYGGDLFSASIAPSVIFSKYFQLAGAYQYTIINFKNLNEEFISHLTSLNLSGAINVKLSMSAFIQFNSLQSIGAVNYRLRYNPVDGNDLYLVYNESFNTDPTMEIPNLPISDNRAIMLKYIHTFQL